MTESKSYIHQELASGRWHTMSLANQIGNVGSEYERALRGKAKGDVRYFERAQACLVELLDLTIADPRWSKRRITRLRQLRQIIFDELDNDVQPPRDLHKYFLLAAVWANKQRAEERNRQSAIANRK